MLRQETHIPYCSFDVGVLMSVSKEPARITQKIFHRFRKGHYLQATTSANSIEPFREEAFVSTASNTDLIDLGYTSAYICVPCATCYVKTSITAVALLLLKKYSLHNIERKIST